MRVALFLLILSALAFLPFFGFPEWRGTEARRVQIATEMVQTGDYLVPRLWGEATFAKPPFYYWLLAVSFHAFGVEPWSARLPSVLAFWLLAVVAYRFLRRWHDVTSARLGSGCVLLSPLVMHDVPFAEIDPVFAALTATSMLCLADGVYDRRRRILFCAGVLGGLAVLAKGPPYLMFLAGPLVLWFRHRRFDGLIWFLTPVFSFYLAYAVALRAVGTADGVSQVAVQESLGRLEFWQPRSLLAIPGHLLKCAVLIGLPFSFWLVRWFRHTRLQDDHASQRQNFLLWSAVGACLVLLFSAERSTRYLLPAAPLMICGLAPLAARNLRDESRPPDWIRKCLSVVGITAGLAAAAIVWVPHPYPGTTGLALLAVGCVALVIHSRGQLVRFAVILPLVIAWTAFPDRITYAMTAADFAPKRAAVLARELESRGIDAVETDGHVGTSILLHTNIAMGSKLNVIGDFEQRLPQTLPWLIVVDRGTDPLREVDGYLDVVRIQLDEESSLSLRARR